MRWKLNRWTVFVCRWQKAIKKINPEFSAYLGAPDPGVGYNEDSLEWQNVWMPRIGCSMHLFWNFFGVSSSILVTIYSQASSYDIIVGQLSSQANVTLSVIPRSAAAADSDGRT